MASEGQIPSRGFEEDSDADLFSDAFHGKHRWFIFRDPFLSAAATYEWDKEKKEISIFRAKIAIYSREVQT